MDAILRLKEIVNRNDGSVTADERDFIRQQASQQGVKLPRARSCGNCWIDCAVMVLVSLKSKEKGHYTLRDGVDILFNGERVNAATLTDARAERWLAAGLSKKYFVWS